KSSGSVASARLIAGHSPAARSPARHLRKAGRNLPRATLQHGFCCAALRVPPRRIRRIHVGSLLARFPPGRRRGGPSEPRAVSPADVAELERKLGSLVI